MASLEPCRYCNGEGWITPQITEDKKQMDDRIRCFCLCSDNNALKSSAQYATEMERTT